MIVALESGERSGMTAKVYPRFQIVRSFGTSPERLFDAWIKPEMMRRWMFVSPTNEIRDVNVDVRVAGRYSILEYSDGEEVDHFGEYEIIERPTTLVFTLIVPNSPWQNC